MLKVLSILVIAALVVFTVNASTLGATFTTFASAVMPLVVMALTFQFSQE